MKNDVSFLMDLSDKILADPVIRWVFSNADRETYLVGGYIRDLLLGRINQDQDFVLRRNARKTALAAAKKYNGTFIELKQNMTFRVALDNNRFLDFAVMEKSIQEDLGSRDFTINAIAWSSRTGLIDPFDGMSEIKNKIIRVIDPKNLSADPLRVLRAYRLSSQLDFVIEKESQKYLKQYSSGLKKVAGERITEELFKLLNTKRAGSFLEICAKHKVLHHVLSLSSCNIKVNCNLIMRFDNLLNNLSKNKGISRMSCKIYSILHEKISKSLTRSGFIRLSLLTMAKNTYSAKDCDNMLVMSKVIQRGVKGIHDAMCLVKSRITEKRLYKIFSSSEEHEYEIAVILSILKQRPVNKYVDRATDYIIIKKKCLLNGNEIKRLANVKPGPIIGEIQDALREKKFTGKMESKDDARKWIISNLT